MLRWDSARFAKALDVGVATVKRVEAGHAISDEVLRVMLARLPGLGVVVIESDAERGIVGGVALTSKARLAGVVHPAPKRDQEPT